MKIALVDISILGHRASYFKYFSKTLVDAGNEVYIFCPNTNELRKSIEPGVAGQVHFTEYALPKPKTFLFRKCEAGINVIRNWMYTSDNIAQNAPGVDLVFFMGLDYFIPTFSEVVYFRFKFYKILNRLIPLMINWAFRFKWSGLNLRLDLEIEHVHKAKNNVAIGVLDEYFNFNNDNLNRRLIVFPDIANVDVSEAKTSLEKNIIAKAKGRKIISILGAMDKRKSIITFLNIAQLSENKEYFFVIAGTPIYQTFNEFELDRLKSIKNEIGNCYFFPESIEDGPEFNALMRLSDVVFASYLEFQNSSNILTKAAYFRKPVIVSKRGCMGKRIQRFKTGLSMEEGMVSEGIETIDEAVNRFDYSLAEFDHYYTFHSQLALQKALMSVTDLAKSNLKLVK